MAKEISGHLEESLVHFLECDFSLEGQGVGKDRGAETKDKSHVVLITGRKSTGAHTHTDAYYYAHRYTQHQETTQYNSTQL